MGLLKPASNTTAFAKIGLQGFPGSGKTFTASELARGLAAFAKSNQVAFFDTEKGSDFEVTRMQKHGFQLLVHKGRAYRDLLAVIKEVEEAKIPVLIIDSITHVWRELTDSYKEKMKKKSLTMYDWGILKTQWKEFTDLFLNSKLNIIMCGRAAYEYEHQTNEDTGKQEIFKSGTKMSVEGTTGYEPDLLIEMERVTINDKVLNRAYILKDRSDTINGKFFDMPNFKTFQTFFSSINLGGEHHGVDTNRDSKEMFDDPDWSEVEKGRRKEIALEEIKGLFIKLGLDGTANEVKKKRVETLEKYFGTNSWTAIENSHPRKLEEILKLMKNDLLPKENVTIVEGAKDIA